MLKSIPKKIKKVKIKTLKDKLWKIFALYIKYRDTNGDGFGHCISCGDRLHYKQSNAGHFIPKAQGNSIYFDEDNVHMQCVRCNLTLCGNQYRYGKALRLKIGDEAVEAIYKRAEVIKKITEPEYRLLIEHYSGLLKDYNK
jgi:hypothetical protein